MHGLVRIDGKEERHVDVDSVDAQRFTSFGMNLASHVQDAYIQFRAGLIDKSVWEAELNNRV